VFKHKDLIMATAAEKQSTTIKSQEKIDSVTVNNILEAIEHDQIILNVAKELLKEVVQGAIDLENKKETPSLENVIDHIKSEEWSELFAESAQRTVELIKNHL
jgi:proline dehydrogenase